MTSASAAAAANATISRCSATSDPETAEFCRLQGARLRAMRMERGLTQERLGDIVGLTFQQIQKYERGANRISAPMLYRLRGVLGCRISDFFPSDADEGPSFQPQEDALKRLSSSLGEVADAVDGALRTVAEVRAMMGSEDVRPRPRVIESGTGPASDVEDGR